MGTIDFEFLKSFAFPAALVSEASGRVEVTGEALFPAPDDAKDVSQLEFYQECPLGWSVCPLGYAVYKLNFDYGEFSKVVIYGLKIQDFSKKKGKSEILSINLKREQFDRYIRMFFSSMNASEDLFQSIIRSGIHEVRGLNRDLSSAIYALKDELSKKSIDPNIVLNYVKNAEALSETLKIRSDLFDVISNPSILDAKGGTFPVYRVFDRMRRSLQPSADSRGVEIRISGDSQKRVRGVKMFDVIPYVILQNSIKYAPSSTYIKIDIRDGGDFIFVIVSSFGPILAPGEETRLFDMGFRGQNAVLMQGQGSGIGLALAKKLIELHDDATLTVFQEGDKKVFNNMDFAMTHFHLRFKVVD